MRRGPVFSTFLAFALGVSAFEIPVTRKRTVSSVQPFHVYSLAGLADTGDPQVTNVQDLLYSAEVTIGGINVPVQLDTGSTDLWIYGPQFPGILSKAQNISNSLSNITYGIGSVSGEVSIIDIEFAGIHIQNQALLNGVKANFDNIFSIGVYGILGLGFDTLSAVADAFTDGRGRSVLSNIFAQNASEPNHIAVQLDRFGDLDETGMGSFSIGTFDEKYIAVKDSPVLPVFSTEAQARRWSVALDAFEVAGRNVTLPKSTVPNAPSGKLISVLDTGASSMSIPRELVSAIYSSVDGAVYFDEVDMWFVPCLAAPEVALWFGGKRYPMHPLDTTQPHGFQFGTWPNQTYCTSAISPYTFSAGVGELDLLLGDNFLRNVYSVFDFGDTDPATGKNGQPYMKLLSVTNETEAGADFKASRTKALSSLPSLGDISALIELAKSDNETTTATSTTSTSSPPTKTGTSNLAGVADNDGSNSEIAQSVNKLVGLAPAMLGLLGLNALLVLVLVGMGVVLLRKKGSGGGVTRGVPRYEPVRLPPKNEGGVVGYDEPYEGRRYDA